MKCSKHYERDAVSQCLDCGKALCPECTNKFSVPLCDHCALSRIAADRQLLVKNSIMMIVLFIIGFSLSNGSLPGRLLNGYFWAGIPWGWSILTKITPRMFLFMSWIGWVIYFFVKCMLSAMIGMFVTPYRIYKVVKGLKEAKALEEYTKNAAI